jgi:Zn-dependent M16 (insulinase) family peptidase
MYFRGVTEDIRKQGRRDLLAMNNEKLGSYCEALTKTMDSAAVCVVGNDDALEKCRDEGFKTLEKI